MNAYRALASPSLICLTAKDPILSAFQLSWELRRLSFEEHEFRSEYQDLKKKCKVFATALLDHTRSSHELEIILNHDPLEPVIHSEGRMHLRRLRLAVRFHQKEFVTHPNVQQLLASIWYEGLPGFRRKNVFLQFFETVRIAVSFPFLSLMYIMAPTSSYGQTLKKPFIKFICHSASYLTFLAILIWASQKKGDEESKQNNNEPINYVTKTASQRARPSVPEYLIIAWLCGMIKLEVRRILGEENLKEYVKDMWKVMDLGTTCLYVIVIILRLLAYFEVVIVRIPSNKRTQCWDPAVDAMVLSECLLAVANIFSCLRMIYIFSVSQYLGPMQVSLSRMVTDMVRFFLLFMLVLFAFSCGLNQLLWYYAATERKKCCEMNTTAMSQTGNRLNSSSSSVLCLTTTHWNKNDTWTASKSESICQLNSTASASGDDCEIRMRFANLFEAMQTLFWTVFGVIDMNQFNLSNIESFTKFSAKTILGTYTVITNVVLLNLLIAMLNNSYQLISGREDVEWKFARSKLWISYFDDKCTLPPPFNVLPTSKFLVRLGKFFKCCPCYKSRFFSECCSCDSTPVVTSEPEELREELLKEQESNYEKVMHRLVGRYIMMSQQSAEHNAVSEDDINELKQDISAFRCELIDILQQSGYTVNAYCNAGLGGRKTRQRERRMMKNFDVIPTREDLPHLQHEIVSSTAPVLTAASKPATTMGSSALVALKKKRKKFFAASPKDRGSSNKQILHAGSTPQRSSSVMQQKAQPLQVQSQKQAEIVEGIMSPSTTSESVTTHSSDTFEASVESQEELVSPTVKEGL
ncbi:hypothetical protein B7P43_G16226 [Cryptotermes secundus]|nr:hypothetical protein B7P43_G16226 [Cryptotermes secundus]